MTDIFPAIEPYETRFLDVSDGHRLHVALSGTPKGLPALLLHGGPGSGMSASARRYFDPSRFHIIQFDQRGCGLSTPNAAKSLEHNTTHHLIDDMEAIRASIGIESWMVFGTSWGSTLALAYAQRFPRHVRAMVLAGVTTTRKMEIEWLYKGLSMFRPRQWQRFIATIPDAEMQCDPVAAYYKLLTDADVTIREAAALEWHLWESGSITSSAGAAFPAKWQDNGYRLTRARLCAHYFQHSAWIEDGALIREAEVLAGVPGVLVQGTQDLQGPPVTAFELAAAWPGSELVLVDGAGHATSDTGMEEAILSATARFAL